MSNQVSSTIVRSNQNGVMFRFNDNGIVFYAIHDNSSGTFTYNGSLNACNLSPRVTTVTSKREPLTRSGEYK